MKGEEEKPKLNYWNYRVLRSESNGEYNFAIHEVYYTDDKPTSWTISPISIGGDTWNECFKAYDMIENAFHKDVLIIKGDELIPVGRFKSNQK